MLKCGTCGNTRSFIRVYDATVTKVLYPDGEEEEIWGADHVNLLEDPQDSCVKCGSYMIEEV